MKKRLWRCNLIANHWLAQRSLKAANNANAATVQMATGAAVEANQGEETANATNVPIAKRTVAIQIGTMQKMLLQQTVEWLAPRVHLQGIGDQIQTQVEVHSSYGWREGCK
jgi:hypothetical protein